MDITVIPAYRRDYTNKKEVLKAFNDNLDFKIQDAFNKWDGSYCNKQDLKAYTSIKIRFNNLSDILIINQDNPGKTWMDRF